MGQLALVGTFPPPVSGLAVATESLADALILRSIDVDRLDVGPSRARSRLAMWIVKGYRCVRTALRLVRTRPPTVLLGADAGIGLIAQIPVVAIGRLTSRQVFVAHHSRRTSEQPGILVRLLVTAAGGKAVHIFPCDQMCKSFQHSIGKHVHCAAVSNGHTLLDPRASSKPRRDPVRIGHMSNLTVAKGFGLAGRAVALLADRGVNAHFVLAGEVSDEAALKELVDLADLLGKRFDHIGRVDGDDKREFLRSLDVFVHPSSHPHECYSIAVWEALAVGVPVVATRVACLNDAAIAGGGVLVDVGATAGEVAEAIVTILEAGQSEYSDRAVAAATADSGIAQRQIDQLAESVIAVAG